MPSTGESARTSEVLIKMREYVLNAVRVSPCVWKLRDDAAYVIPGASSTLYDSNILTFTSNKHYRTYTKSELDGAFKLGTSKRKRNSFSVAPALKKRRLITTEKETIAALLQKNLISMWKKLKYFEGGQRKNRTFIKKGGMNIS